MNMFTNNVTGIDIKTFIAFQCNIKECFHIASELFTIPNKQCAQVEFLI